MDRAIALGDRFPLPWRWVKILLTYSPFLITILFTGLQTDAPIADLTRDIFVTAQLPSYAGFLSNVGAFTWCAATTTCGLGLCSFWQRQETITRNFFIYAGCISGVLMVDDFFLLHERYYPAYFNLSEVATYLLYGIGFLVFITTFRSFIRKTNFLFLGASLLFFGISILMDVIESFFFDTQVEILPDPLILVEDGSKLLGIASWFIYLVTVFLKRTYQTGRMS